MIDKNVLREKLRQFPRVTLGVLPTPLQEAPRLSQALGGPRLLIKRDDLTGLAFGGNKTRMFEFLLAEAIKQGADTVIGGAGVQSNYCRQLAAACSHLGLEAHLVLRRIRGTIDDEIQGNLLLDLLTGAKVHLLNASMDEQRSFMYRLSDKLRTQGRKPFVARMAQSVDLVPDVISYVDCFLEILDQCAEQNVHPTHLYCSSYDSTQAGLEMANAVLGSKIKIIGIAPANWEEDPAGLIAQYANQASSRLGLGECVDPSSIVNTEAYVGDGYGSVTQDGIEMLKLVARTEGIFLDPVYTSKVFAAIRDHIRDGSLTSLDTVLFLHTGGNPALFAYADALGTDELRSHLHVVDGM